MTASISSGSTSRTPDAERAIEQADLDETRAGDFERPCRTSSGGDGR
jgi:hypothetical protein